MSRQAGAEAFAERAWGDAYRAFRQVPRQALDGVDLDRFAIAAYLVGDDDEAEAAWAEAYHRHLDTGERGHAAQDAFWAGFCLMLSGQTARAGGWLSRCEKAIASEVDCPARGYLLVPALLGALDAGDAAGALELAGHAAQIATRFRDADLAALAMLGRGQALVAAGHPAAGMAQFDEVMLAVSAGEAGPIVSGIVYCAVILECVQLFDMGRAAEWTAALDEWCRTQPDLVLYRGQCLVHQSQIKQATGDWRGAANVADEACGRLRDARHPALGLACYQQGELHRLHGDVDAAAGAYRRASRTGYEPMPGLALLELQRGHTGSAMAGIRRALDEEGPRFRRPGLLAAAVEIEVVAGDVAAAAQAAAELDAIAADAGSRVLRAMADHATGAALLAADRTGDAMVHLRSASSGWQRLGMPYEAARSAVLVGLGCAALGDAASAAIELDNARATFASLGAGADLRRVLDLSGAPAPRGGLSSREIEVLRLVADGQTSREIASSLAISHHTVRRHLENTFAKLGVNSRAAAVAYAYEHHML